MSPQRPTRWARSDKFWALTRLWALMTLPCVFGAPKSWADMVFRADQRKLEFPYGANVPGPPGISLSRMGRLLTSMTCWRMAKASVLSTIRGMGLSARLGLVCHLAIANLLALAHFSSPGWWRACRLVLDPVTRPTKEGTIPTRSPGPTEISWRAASRLIDPSSLAHPRAKVAS